jgi:hypothetical protein
MGAMFLETLCDNRIAPMGRSYKDASNLNTPPPPAPSPPRRGRWR